tara:strand:+ start:50274 stop:51515 length:1242 start_codon:yes stop_codon:yes gene_type:complete
MKNAIQVGSSNYTTEEAIPSVERLREWANAGLRAVGELNTKIRGAGSAAEIAARLTEPYNELIRELNLLTPEKSTGSDVSATWARCGKIVKEITDGSTIGPDSPVFKASRHLNINWSVVGYVATVLGYTPDSADPEMINVGRQQARIDLAAGAAVADLFGFAPQDSAPFELRKLRSATRRALDACQEVERLRVQYDEGAKAWEKSRTESADRADAQFGETIKQNSERLAALYAEHQSRMAQIEANFRDRLVLDGPAAYWEKRAARTVGSAFWALAAFIVLVLLFVGITSTVGPDHVRHVLTAIQMEPPAYTDAGASSSLTTAILGFGLVTTPAVMALWILMLISRIFRENFHLSNDAKHRHMLITTYLSLAEAETNPVSTDDREYALRAIFSVPSEASADDALTALGNYLGKR